MFPYTYIKVTLDRLKLLALLDRNLTFSETLLSIILGVLVAIFGAILLYVGFYEDLKAFLFCFIVASCQYSLLKSVQPDAASPTHGFNRIIAYSRPVYFCIFAGVSLILHYTVVSQNSDYLASCEANRQINGYFPCEENRFTTLEFSRDLFASFILFFPVIFSIGLFPQINTFLLYLLEQIDMHIFGGNAMSSLAASFYCIFRSVVVISTLYGFAYGGLTEAKGTRHVLFSIFCAGLVASSYHLSRAASDPCHIWTMVKANLWPPDIYRERKRTIKTKVPPKPKKTDKEINEKEESQKAATESPEKLANEDIVDPLPAKMQKTINGRLKSDVIICSLIALLVFGKYEFFHF